ncbi:VWA domain-containing protein [Selenomonas sp. TAMA-11512]|uniref:vWA domain-containing protein n=1 Tax=Selenomonas sp. TAMA-11512 TaxID=3095337 RepID=UPI0030878DBE|nr:VWA domain-containing protein [Selenomonas sp. TAMA-11512]
MRKKWPAFVLTLVLCSFFCSASPIAAAQKEKPDCVELVLVLDKSGSMAGLESDTIGGFNAMIAKEKKLDAKVNVTTVFFSDVIDTIYDREDIRHIQPLTDEKYEVGGMTALLDAVGSTILKVSRTKDIEKKGTKVVFVIITDGMENASKEFTQTKVKEMISDKQEKAGWDFIYLGANIDAAKEASSIGVDQKNAVTYRSTGTGVRRNFEAVSAYVAGAVENSSDDWKDHVEKDEVKN